MDENLNEGEWASKPEPIRYSAQRDQFIDALIRKAASHPFFWNELGDLAVAIMKDREGNG